MYKKGNSSLIPIIVVLAILGIIAGVYFLFFTNSSHSTSPSTSSTQGISEESSVKTYSHTSSGISFKYPKDFTVKSEKYDQTTGTWVGVLSAPQGDVDMEVSKKLSPISEPVTKHTLKIAGRDVTIFTIPKSTCQVGIAQTYLNSDYDIRFSLQSCTTPLAELLKDPKNISTAINSLDTIISTFTFTK